MAKKQATKKSKSSATTSSSRATVKKVEVNSRASASKKSEDKATAKVKVISLAERNELIAKAAFLKACSRNFQGGDQFHDWIQAEKEIDNQLKGYHIN